MPVAGRAEHQAWPDDRRRTTGPAAVVQYLPHVAVAKVMLQLEQYRAGTSQPTAAGPGQRRRLRQGVRPAANARGDIGQPSVPGPLDVERIALPHRGGLDLGQIELSAG